MALKDWESISMQNQWNENVLCRYREVKAGVLLCMFSFFTLQCLATRCDISAVMHSLGCCMAHAGRIKMTEDLSDGYRNNTMCACSAVLHAIPSVKLFH